MKLQFLGIIAVLFLLAGCANLPSQNTWNSLTGQDGRTWGYTQIQAAEQAKAIFSRPFNAKGRGRTYSRHQIKFDQIVLPPNSLNTLKLRTYCMDKSVPAPKRNEKLYLVPVGKLIDSQIYPIYNSLMKYSHSHPGKHTQIQRIIWNLRSTKNPSEMRNEDYALLDTISPGASQVVRSYFYTKNLTDRATDFLSDTAGKLLNQHGLGTNFLNQQNLVSTALHSLSQSNRQVDSILRSLESMPVSGLIPNDNSDYSLLTNGVAVKATHRGGARNSELTIRNTTDHPVVFQPAQFALESKRKTQRLGVGGVEKMLTNEATAALETDKKNRVKTPQQIISELQELGILSRSKTVKDGLGFIAKTASGQALNKVAGGPISLLFNLRGDTPIAQQAARYYSSAQLNNVENYMIEQFNASNIKFKDSFRKKYGFVPEDKGFDKKYNNIKDMQLRQKMDWAKVSWGILQRNHSKPQEKMLKELRTFTSRVKRREEWDRKYPEFATPPENIIRN